MTDEKQEEKEIKKAPSKKKTVMVPVKVIQAKGKSSLVQYLHAGKLARCFVPSDAVIADKVSLDELNAGIVYGHDWSRVGDLKIDGAELDQELKRNGVYTLADLHGKPREVNLLLMKLAGATKQNLIEFARKQEA